MTTRRPSRTRTALIGGGLAVAVAAAVVGGALLSSDSTAEAAGDGHAAHQNPTTTVAATDPRAESDRRAAEELRTTTAKYRDVQAALADGFAPAGGCTELPGQGSMGYHYINLPRAMDPAVDPAAPEALLYVKAADGTMQLAGVEWVVMDPDQDLATDAGRPTLFDHPFDGPMEGHEPGMPKHFDLHAWVWQDNPSGTFAPWNPALSC